MRGGGVQAGGQAACKREVKQRARRRRGSGGVEAAGQVARGGDVLTAAGWRRASDALVEI